MAETTAQLLQELSGSHLLLSANDNPPLFSIKKQENGSFTYEGFHVDMGSFMAKVLNITYSFVNVKADELKRFGAREASTLLLARDEVNISTRLQPSNFENCIALMDCAVPVINSPSALMVPWPKEESRVFAIIRPFQNDVWLALLGTVIVMTFALVWLQEVYSRFVTKNNKNKQTALPTPSASYFGTALGDAALYIFTILTNQGNFLQLNHLSYRLAVGFWCLMASILLNAYAGNLLSAVVVPNLEPVPRSLEDIANGYPDPNVQLITEKRATLANRFFAANSGSYKVIGDMLRNHPELLITTVQETMDMMDTGKYVYPSVDMLLYPFLDRMNKKAGFCKFTVSNRNLYGFEAMLAPNFKKNWRYTRAVNSKLQLWAETGLAYHWLKKNMPRIDRCMLDNYRDTADADLKRLSLEDLSGAFYTLFCGCILSFLVFLWEKLHRKSHKV